MLPILLHFASQNPSKTFQKPTPRGTKILIDFCIAFLSFLAPFWPPTWGQLGAQDGFKIEKMRSKNSGVAHQERFEMRPCFSTPSWAVLAPFWPPTWRHFGPSWLRFGPSWLRLGSVLASKLRFLSQTSVLQEMGGGPPRTGASIKSADPLGGHLAC